MSTLPRVLLLGDSIRLSYQPHVAKLLADEAKVVGSGENSQYTQSTIDRLDAWLKECGMPDIVHWNNGLHDVGHNTERDPVQYPLETYMDNLKTILGRLRQIGAKIIWATTTPVRDEETRFLTSWSWRNSEIDTYNAAARKFMEAEGVPIDDLHAIIAANHDSVYIEDGVHLNETGQKLCAKAVATAVRKIM